MNDLLPATNLERGMKLTPIATTCNRGKGKDFSFFRNLIIFFTLIMDQSPHFQF